MYEADQARGLLTSLHALLSAYKVAYECVLEEEIVDELHEMAANGEIQIVGPELYQALPERGWRAHHETPERKRRRATIQRMWNCDGASSRTIAACLDSKEETIAQEVARMRQQGYRMLEHKRGGGLAETLVPSG